MQSDLVRAREGIVPKEAQLSAVMTWGTGPHSCGVDCTLLFFIMSDSPRPSSETCLYLYSSASPVIENGQLECPQGYKRLNLTHCQGKDDPGQGWA